MSRILDTVRKDIADYVFTDYQDNVWYNGHEKAEPVEILRPYWDEYVADRKEAGFPVPEGLTPELYCAIWDAWYDVRTAIEAEARR